MICTQRVARDWHTIAPGPLECTSLGQFAAQWNCAFHFDYIIIIIVIVVVIIIIIIIIIVVVAVIVVVVVIVVVIVVVVNAVLASHRRKRSRLQLQNTDDCKQHIGLPTGPLFSCTKH